MGFGGGDPQSGWTAPGPYDEDRVLPNNTALPWLFEWKSALRFQRPGCYGMQIDTANGSDVLVFQVFGPTMARP
jgi:hypothetical protein